MCVAVGPPLFCSGPSIGSPESTLPPSRAPLPLAFGPTGASLPATMVLAMEPVMSDTPPALYPNLPTLKAATGSNWTMAAWRGIAAPKNIPAEARDKLVAAIKKIATGKDYSDFMSKQGFGVIYAAPDDFAKFMAKSDADLGATMKAVGIVK